MKNSVGNGAFLLILSGIICKIFGALFRLPLINIIGIEGIGVFQMVMSLYSLSLVIVTGGVTNTLSKLVSSARAKGDYNKINGYFRIALIFSAGLSLFLGVSFAVFAGQISSSQGVVDAKYSYMLLSFLLPLGALIGVYKGIIQGYENMFPTALSQIIEQSAKLCFGLFFAKILINNGVASGVFGAFLGITISEVLAFLYLFLVLLIKYKTKAVKSDVNSSFFKAVLPLSVGGSIIPLTHAIDSLFIVNLLIKAGYSQVEATKLYGLHTGVVGAILNFPLIISLALAMSLLPKISYLSTIGENSGQISIITKSFTVLWMFVLPIVFGISSTAEIVFPIIYPNLISGYLNYVLKLTYIGSVAIILTALMQFFISILQAKGLYIFAMGSSIFASIIKIFLFFSLSVQKNINIFALPISNIFLAGTVCLFAIIKLKKIIKVPIFNFFLPLLSSLIMFLIVKILINLFNNVWGLIFAIFCGAMLYCSLILPLVLEYLKPLLKKRNM